MNIYAAALVIFLTFLGTSLWMTRTPPPPPESAVPSPPPPLTVAGRLDLDPFPDTGPLLIMGEHSAALAQLERDVKDMIREAETAIPLRWRS